MRPLFHRRGTRGTARRRDASDRRCVAREAHPPPGPRCRPASSPATAAESPPFHLRAWRPRPAFVGAFAAGAAVTGADDPQGRRLDPIAFSGDSITLAASCDDLLDWYVARGVDRVGPWGWDTYDYERGRPRFRPVRPRRATRPTAGAAAGPADRRPGDASTPRRSAVHGPRGTNGDSGTNVQEPGVDEPDVVKTDGRTLFRVEDDDLVTYDVTGDGGRADRVGRPRATCDDGEVLLAGRHGRGRSALDGGGSGTYYGPRPARPGSSSSTSPTPADPEVEHTYLYSSATLEARLHGDTVRLVTQAGLPDLDFERPTAHDRATRSGRTARSSASTEIDDWLPTVTTDGGDPEPLVDCEDVAIPNDGDSLGTIAVVGFDADAPDERRSQRPRGRHPAGLRLEPTSSTSRPAAWQQPGRRRACDFCAERATVAPALAARRRRRCRRRQPPLRLRPRRGRDDVRRLRRGRRRDPRPLGDGRGRRRPPGGGRARRSRTGNFNSVVTFRQRRQRPGRGRPGRRARRRRGHQVGALVRRPGDRRHLLQVDPLYAVDLTDPDDPDAHGRAQDPGLLGVPPPARASTGSSALGEGPGDRTADWGAQAGLFNVTDLTDPRQLDVRVLRPQHPGARGARPAPADLAPGPAHGADRGQSTTSKGGQVGLVSVLSLGDGAAREPDGRGRVRQRRQRRSGWCPLPDGRVVLVTGGDAEFFDL